MYKHPLGTYSALAVHIPSYASLLAIFKGECSDGKEKLANGRIESYGRKRKSSEESREEFWWKKAVRRVGVAYRELIGSLYESWTIGIERVYK